MSGTSTSPMDGFTACRQGVSTQRPALNRQNEVFPYYQYAQTVTSAGFRGQFAEGLLVVVEMTWPGKAQAEARSTSCRSPGRARRRQSRASSRRHCWEIVPDCLQIVAEGPDCGDSRRWLHQLLHRPAVPDARGCIPVPASGRGAADDARSADDAPAAAGGSRRTATATAAAPPQVTTTAPANSASVRRSRPCSPAPHAPARCAKCSGRVGMLMS